MGITPALVGLAIFIPSMSEYLRYSVSVEYYSSYLSTHGSPPTYDCSGAGTARYSSCAMTKPSPTEGIVGMAVGGSVMLIGGIVAISDYSRYTPKPTSIPEITSNGAPFKS